MQYADSTRREEALSEYCQEAFGFLPLGHIDLDLPVDGVTGVAYILPQAVSPGTGKHRVYTKRMLLSDGIDEILPEWAFFIRAVIDTDSLSPTASREQLHNDEILGAVRDSLGKQIKDWARTTLSQSSPLASKILITHHLALRALAVTDDDMLSLVAEILPFETSDGELTLREVTSRSPGGEIVHAPTTDA